MNHLKQILILALFLTVLIASPLLADDSQSVDEQISALIEQLYDVDYTTGTYVADQLQRIGPASIPYLAEAMESDNRDQVTYASLAIRRFGVDALPELMEALASEKAFTRYSAAATISWMKYDASIAIGPLMWMLEDEHPDVRAQAAVTLGAMGKAAKSVEHSLADALWDIDPQVRDKAALALEKIGADTDATLNTLSLVLIVETTDAASSMASALATFGDSAIDPLTLALDAESPFVRASAVVQLGKLADGDDDIIADIIAMFEDEDYDVRKKTARAVELIGPAASDAIPYLIDALYEEEVSWLVFSAFTAIGDKAVPGIVEILQSDNRFARANAAHALKEIGEPASEAVPALIAALDDEDLDVRCDAIYALGKIGDASRSAVGKIATFLEDDDYSTRWRAAQCLAGIGSEAAPAIPDIVDAYYDGRINKADALKQIFTIDPRYDGLIPMLIEALDTKKGKAWSAAGEILIELGNEGIDVLFDILANGSDTQRYNAALALYDFTEVPDEAVSILTDMLYEEGPWPVSAAIRMFSEHRDLTAPATSVPRLIQLFDIAPAMSGDIARILGKIGPGASDAVPSLLPLLESDSILTRVFTARALGRIGVASVEVISKLQDALTDENENVCQAAAKALGEIGPDASDALPALRKAIKGWDKELRVEAAMAIYRITGDSWEAVIALTEELWAFSVFAKLKAIEYLGEIGPDASDALPRLYEMDKYETDDSTLREDILIAIGEING